MRLRSSVASSEADWEDKAANPSPPTSRQPMGELLVEAGAIEQAEVDTILEEQTQSAMLFGEICLERGLADPPLIRRMLDRQYDTPMLDPDDDRIDPLVASAFGLDPALARGMRSLRASLFGRREAGAGHFGTVTMIGAEADEESSVLTANFAVVAAQLGHSVLLVDADFSAPAQHGLFRAPNRSGVTTLLTGDREAPPAVIQTAMRRLWLLPSGPWIPHPAQLLEREPLGRRLRAIGAGFDLVVVDAGVQDPDIAAAVAAGSDGAILIVKRHRTPVKWVNSMVERLTDRGVDCLGTILT